MFSGFPVYRFLICQTWAAVLYFSDNFHSQRQAVRWIWLQVAYLWGEENTGRGLGVKQGGRQSETASLSHQFLPQGGKAETCWECSVKCGNHTFQSLPWGGAREWNYSHAPFLLRPPDEASEHQACVCQRGSEWPGVCAGCALIGALCHHRTHSLVPEAR